MNKTEETNKLNELNLMFNNCGDGLEIYYMGIVGKKEVFRIARELENGKKVNWTKVRNILNKNSISFMEGHRGEGRIFSKCIDTYF
jgi:hypothetical protein